ncbi:glycosyltransferase [Candidatus Kaiserbacteria bacterium]|nr:glycosyltransferase [Candidatus Kaiserbacteria bacterium]
MDGITVVVCTRNVRDLLERNLPVIRRNVPRFEILVVDGDSTDGTCEVAAKFADKVISDEGRGLAYARHLGIMNASHPYVLFCGPDNTITEGLANRLRDALKGDAKLAGVAPQTRVLNKSTYWERTTGAFFRHFINRVGPVAVIGTPCMYKRDVILKVPYDVSIRSAGDDTDLALRLHEAGYTLAIIDAYSDEDMPLDRSAFIARWRWYGKGDAEFYAKHRSRWTWKRCLRSLMHPLYSYGIRATWVLLSRGVPQYIPGFYVAVWARYAGWIARARELREVTAPEG